jgi:hypothetical protein
MAKKSTAASTKPEDGKQDIEALTERYKALNERKIEAQTNLKTAENQLAALRKKAREDYETDNLDALRKKLQDMKDENERKRAQYQESLDTIENELGAVEKAHAEAASGSAQASEEDEGN